MPPVQMRVWMTWSELTNGPRITKEQFQAQLAKYPKSSILIACTKLSVGLGYGPDACTDLPPIFSPGIMGLSPVLGFPTLHLQSRSHQRLRPAEPCERSRTEPRSSAQTPLV